MLKTLAGVGLMLIGAAATPVRAQNVQFEGMPGVVAMAPGTNGVFHGNYCGLGSKGPGLPPTDALDAACMHHDACTPAGQLPSCSCNARFMRETSAVATGAAQPDDLKALATMVEASIPVIPCR